MSKLKYLFLLLACLSVSTVFGQLKVSISIDDVPNTKKFERDGFQSVFLNKLDSLQIPISIFINEGYIYKTDHFTKNFDLLNQWVKREYITVGNHSFNHSRYSIAELDSFAIQVQKGEAITRELTKKYNKELNYFRFPYNDLGKDSIQQAQIADLLNKKDYTIAPFTIESVDYVFSYLYEYYLKENQKQTADSIAHAYIDITLELFDFFDSLAIKQYGRSVNQIYLCHDNSLNADYIDLLVKKLSERNYSFISFDEAMTDTIYNQSNYYYKKWGVSWIYRWMKVQKERVKLMRLEPDVMDYYNSYQELKQEKEAGY